MLSARIRGLVGVKVSHQLDHVATGRLAERGLEVQTPCTRGANPKRSRRAVMHIAFIRTIASLLGLAQHNDAVMISWLELAQLQTLSQRPVSTCKERNVGLAGKNRVGPGSNLRGI